MQTKLKRLAAILALAIGGPATASATTTYYYDNIATANYGIFEFLTIKNGNYAATQFNTSDLRTEPYTNAQNFSSPVTITGGGSPATCGTLGCLLGKITLNIKANGPDIPSGSPNDNFHLSVHSDSGNTVGTTLTLTESRPIDNPAGSIASGTSFSLYEFMPSVDIVLQDATDYWLELTNTWTGGLGIDWQLGSQAGGMIENNAFGFPINGSTVTLAMKFEATPIVSAVPIPGALWLMGSALIGFVGWGRRLAV